MNMPIRLRSASRTSPEMSTDQLIALAEGIAKQYADGHLTVLRFTTNWKVIIGTVQPLEDYGLILAAPAYPTLRKALLGLLVTCGVIHSYEIETGGEQRLTYPR